MKQRVPCNPHIWLSLLIGLIFGLTGVSCARFTPPQPTTQTPALDTPAPTATPEPSLTPTPTASATATPSPLPTWTPTHTPTITLTPTYAILRGKVLVRSNCRYGPGAPYLYKYGLVPGSNLEVIGRNDLGTWILVRAIGGSNPCWVKASLMEVRGDVMSVAPTYIPLPQSPYYKPPSGVSARRNGDVVTISWNPISYRAGDETASPPYLVEAWICTDGRLVFTPIGSYEATIEVVDEAGCSEPSHGRLYFVEKHGYTRWVEIPWPPHQ